VIDLERVDVAERKARALCALDLLTPATALPAGLGLYTRNAGAFDGLDSLVDVVAVRTTP
jgi:hypothetical protein